MSLEDAVRMNEMEVIQSILSESPSEALKADSAGWTPLHIAASVGHNPALRLLLPLSAINAATAGGQTALHYSASRGHLEAVEIILATAGADCIGDRQGWTPLHRAAAGGHAAIIEALVAAFPKEIDRANGEGQTALIVAVQEGKGAAVRVLLEAGADVDRVDGDGMSAMHYTRGNDDILNLLANFKKH